MAASFILPKDTGILITGVEHNFVNVVGDGRYFFVNARTGEALRVHDPVTGVLEMPDETWLVDMLADGQIEFLDRPTGSAMRRLARAQEYSPEEILAADPDAALKHFVCTQADAARVKRGNKALESFLAELWLSDEVRAKYGETPPRAATVRHWLKHRGTPGDRRFADMRDMTGLGGPDSKDALLRHIVRTCGLKYYVNKGRKIADVHAEVAHEVEKANADRGPDEQLKVPSYETVRRAVYILGRRTTMAAKHGARFVQSRWLGAGLPLRASRILEIVMFDHTPIPNVFCIEGEPDIKAGQPILALMIDLYSRCILYYELTFRDPTQGSIGRALLGANTPKSPPSSYVYQYPQMRTICGRPGVVYFDNALYQIARGVEDAYADAGVGVYYVGVDEPTQKAVVERVIQTFQELLFKKLPGATYAIPEMREAGYVPAEHAVVTIAQARALLDEAVALYHITPHDGLNNRQPLVMWQKGADATGINLITRTRQLKAAIGTALFNRTISKDGIELFGLRYTDRRIIPDLLDDLLHLEPRRGRTKSPTVKTKIKYDDLDLGSIEVWNEHRKVYVTVPCDNPAYARGMPLWLHEEIQKAAAAEALTLNTPAQQLAARHRFNERILELLPEEREKEARMLAKISDEPNIRELLAGNVIVQPVEPSSSGMESVVPQTMGLDDRVDAQHAAPRPARRGGSPKRDTRDAGQPRADRPRGATKPGGASREAGQPKPGAKTQPPSLKPRTSYGWS